MRLLSRVRSVRAPRIAPYAAVESAVRQAATLIRGGAPTSSVWATMAAESSGGEQVRDIAALIASGSSCPDAIAAADAPEWRTLSAVWRLADLSGAPLAAALERFANAMRDLGKVSERRGVLLSGPKATIRLVFSLPIIAAVLGWALGFDPLRSFGSPLGLAAAVGGIALLALGVRWASALTRRVADADWVAGWEFELMAIAVSGGAPPAIALRRVADCADVSAAKWVRFAELRADGAVPELVRAAEQVGAELRPMLIAEAEAARLRAHAELERAAERLGVRVLVPLGACVLPAFVLLGAVPVMLAVLSGAGF